MIENLHYIDLKSFLHSVNIVELNAKIEEFRRLDFSRLSQNEIANLVLNLLMVDSENGRHLYSTPKWIDFPSGSKFYRVRRLDKSDTSVPLQNMRIEADAWNPPAEIVPLGRLNKERESLLYTSSAYPAVAIKEMHIDEEELFALIEYHATVSIKTAWIGAELTQEEFPEFTDEEVRKLKVFDEFLHHEFTRKVRKGEEYFYYVSESIAKHFFDLPYQDAWTYPSVEMRNSSGAGLNVCFKPGSAREKLNLYAVQILGYRQQGDNLLLMPRCIVSGCNEHGVFNYHRIGSLEQKRLYPHIITR